MVSGFIMLILSPRLFNCEDLLGHKIHIRSPGMSFFFIATYENDFGLIFYLWV